MRRVPPVSGGRPRGFTLVEVLVALAIGGIAITTIHGLVAAATERARELQRATAAEARRANAYRWLADAFGAVDVGRHRPGPFGGHTNGVEFSTWLLAPGGWSVPERVQLGMTASRFVARLGTGSEVVLADSVEAAAFDYLLESGASAPWLPGWSSAVTPPLAVRLRLARLTGPEPSATAVDTVVFLIGRRG